MHFEHFEIFEKRFDFKVSHSWSVFVSFVGCKDFAAIKVTFCCREFVWFSILNSWSVLGLWSICARFELC